LVAIHEPVGCSVIVCCYCRWLLIVVSVVYCLSVYGWLLVWFAVGRAVIAGYWLLAFGYFVGWLVWLLLYCLFITSLLLLVRFITLRWLLALRRSPKLPLLLLSPAAAGCCRCRQLLAFPFRLLLNVAPAGCQHHWLLAILFELPVVLLKSSSIASRHCCHCRLLVYCCWLVVVVD
jgi:hypothetical protein